MKRLMSAILITATLLAIPADAVQREQRSPRERELTLRERVNLGITKVLRVRPNGDWPIPPIPAPPKP